MISVAAQDWFRQPELQRLLALLNADGGEARVAGGAVRNALMGFAVADVDIATTLRPEAVAERAEAAGIRVVPTGIEHGTVTLVVDGKAYEVTTLRRDVETDGRHARVLFGDDWQADAERRDLTINALYADIHGNVIDLVGGLADIAARQVRFIGDADRRIAEDHLRILRFFRFFAHYGTGRPDAEGLRACARAKASLNRLSSERVWAEVKKLLVATDPSRALLWMRQTGVLGEILPETEKWGIDAIPALIATEAALGWAVDPLLRLAAMLPPDAERLAAMAERLRMSGAEAGRLQAFAEAPGIAAQTGETALERLLYRHGAGGIAMRLKLALASARASASAGDAGALRRAGRLSALLERAQGYRRPQFPISGGDVLAAGVAPGKRVGEILRQLEEFWIERQFTPDRAALTARLDEIVRLSS